MQAERKGNWAKAEEPFKSIIKTRAQLRAEREVISQKRVKERTDETVPMAMDSEEADKNAKRVTSTGEEKSEARIDVLNKFLKTRMGMSVAYHPQAEVAAPAPAPENEVKVAEPTFPATMTHELALPPANTATTSVVPEKEQPTFGVDSKRRKTPPRDTAPPSSSAQRDDRVSPAVPRSSPKQEEMIMEQLIKRFLLKKAAIRQLVQVEGVKKRINMPDFDRDRYRATPGLADRRDRAVKLTEAADLNIEYLSYVASRVRETRIYQEDDFRELMELVTDGQRIAYKSRTEDLAVKNKIIVKKPNEKNQKVRFRMPVLQEFHATMKQFNEHLDAVEQNRDFDYQAVRSDLRREFALAMQQDNLIVDSERFEEEFRRRQLEFVNKNLRSYLDSCMRLAAVYDKFDQLSESLAMLEDNNAINRRLIFQREYALVAPLVEVNGVELFKNFVDAYPGKFEREA